MNNIKKAYNYVIGSIVLTALTVVLVLVAGFVDVNSPDSIFALLRTSEVVAIIGSIMMIVASFFGKLANNKNFTYAFYINIASLLLELVAMILAFAKVESKGLVITLNILNTLASIAAFYFVIMSCKETVPALAKRSIVCAVFVVVGFALTCVTSCLPDPNNDGIMACGVFGGLFFIVGIILFIILIIKTRKSLN